MDFDEIRTELGVATCCGRCEDCAREWVVRCQSRHVALDTIKPVTSPTSYDRHKLSSDCQLA